jgi:hypothetical protein
MTPADGAASPAAMLLPGPISTSTERIAEYPVSKVRELPESGH